ncbi:TPA: hypothetical protein N0F65_008679 [Lagenidium giganteum]|uniref:Nucleolar complex protein 2 n=1 Tax=Lagenidium giganteum TaxID=4803 RepID=A0AAV2ZCW7_9STRA|nr:TPA: hypothetical protein N0F65_008679 [Lagenidium giganteum]
MAEKASAVDGAVLDQPKRRAAAAAAAASTAAAKDAAARVRGSRKRARSAKESVEDEEDAETQDLLAQVNKETRKMKTKKAGRRTTEIFEEFTSLDALLNNDVQERKRKQVREKKLKKLREESESVTLDTSPLAKIMSTMEDSMSSLNADNHLFAVDLPRNQEKFGYVFTPITEALPYVPFKATTTELKSELGRVYKVMQTTDATELGALLWSKAIIIRQLLAVGKSPSTKNVELPARICSWLFATMSTHSDTYIIKGCLSNLYLLIADSYELSCPELTEGLPSVTFTNAVEDFRAVLGSKSFRLGMEWKPTVYDFLNAFRKFGFQDSKRSMSAKSHIPPKGKKRAGRGNAVVEFPTLNMHFVLLFLVLCLRTKVLHLDGYDAFSFTMFFLRMQFEKDLHPEIVQLASICIEELLEVFPVADWRREWGPSFILRIAGANEGLFDSASGWLSVARRLPRTVRGTQLTTGLSIYVLQHRIDNQVHQALLSERPLKLPIQSGLVLDIVAGIVEDLTTKYSNTKSKTPPPFDLLCKKVALMDLALQAFLNDLTQKEVSLLLKKLDELTGAHKSTMSAKWHELKTLVSLMHRKYSRDNLRVGRGEVSPSAKQVLFVDG